MYNKYFEKLLLFLEKFSDRPRVGLCVVVEVPG